MEGMSIGWGQDQVELGVGMGRVMGTGRGHEKVWLECGWELSECVK